MRTFIVLSLWIGSVFSAVAEDTWFAKKILPNGLEVFKEANNYTGRIVGGTEVNVAQFPYQLSLRSNGNHFCGASVIAYYWALSAAHCTFPVPVISTITLRGGSGSHLSGGVIFQAAQIVNHPNYNADRLDFDVSVIRSSTAFIGTNIAPIALLPAGTELATGTSSIVSGWGLTFPGGNIPTNLMAVNIPIVSQATCSIQWGVSSITGNMICAGQQGRDSCNGDSGGPLVSGERQVGIVSWGATQCGGALPGVYTRIASVGIRNFVTSIVVNMETKIFSMRAFFIYISVICFLQVTCNGNTMDSIIEMNYHRRQPAIFKLLRKYSLWPPSTALGPLEQYDPGANISPFIVGGDSTTITSYPFQLSLRNGGVHICGATILSEKWALSAAHCLDDGSSPAWITFRGGSPHKLSGGYLFHAVQIILHENFDSKTFLCDVAVIKIAENFLVDFLQPVQLVDNTIQVSCPSVLATVIGWGTAANGYAPVILQELQVLIQSVDACSKIWIEQITETMLCAGGVLGEDTCNGDSGGPLMCDNYQIGIVSWGSTKCAVEMPAVFTDVSSPEIREFIRNNTGV
ncbi:transmembrane protease serine 9-like [Wyeomyia smithii]|uniref:transmembrane protease serine 9-like n=1 Tax=Wyeomyia smithii TaxID=174621 RepID=UPI002467AEE4|nr:transmembrane protease serine 9-like [Wyeomyia smithii]